MAIQIPTVVNDSDDKNCTDVYSLITNAKVSNTFAEVFFTAWASKAKKDGGYTQIANLKAELTTEQMNAIYLSFQEQALQMIKDDGIKIINTNDNSEVDLSNATIIPD